MANPFLVGPNIQLRSLEESDAELLLPWVNDSEMRRFLPARRYPMSIKSEREWIASMITQKDPQRHVVWAIERKNDGQLIGSVGLHAIDWPRRRAMTGIFLFPQAMRGMGYGTEAKNLVLDYAFGELDLHTIWATVIEGNTASERALEKQGYTKSGVFRKSTIIKGVWRDEIYYDITREEWEAMRHVTLDAEAARPPESSAPEQRRRGRT